MPQCCYLAKGAKRPSHTTNTIKFDRIPFDPCNSIKGFDICPFDQKNSTYLQPPVRQALFEQKLSEAELLNAAILEQTPDADDEVQEELNNASEFPCKTSSELERIVKFLEQFVEHGPSLENAAAPASASANCASSLKMPKFSLPDFDGQYQNWTPFFEQFMASSSKTLPDFQKFN